MEINTQQMEALLQLQEQQAQLPRKNENPAQGFENILTQQLAPGMNPAVTYSEAGMAGKAQASLYSQMILGNTEANEEIDPDTAVFQAAFEQASGTLDLWDSYVRTLGASTSDTALRDAYTLLEGIDAQVAQMRDNPLRGRNAALDSVLNELEILSVTEKFKFNRGDYLS